MKYLKYILVFVPLSVILRLLKASDELVFLSACLSIIPLAGLIGAATENVAAFTGSRVSGLINATMSNVPELFIGIFSVKAGLYNLVLASMAGSIIGNVLLVLGLSILLGGLRRDCQSFNKNNARSNFILLFFAAMSIVIPFTFKYAMDSHGGAKTAEGLTALTLSIALALLVAYTAGLVYSFVTHRNIFVKRDEEDEKQHKAEWSLPLCILVMLGLSALVAVEGSLLVGTVTHIMDKFGLSQVFVGIILIPILGNVTENISAIIMAVKDKVDICVEIAVGSSIQIALFVAPALILAGHILGRPFVYVYDLFEVTAILSSIGISLYVFHDGKTNWLEGLVLICSYAVLGIAFYFL